MPKNARGFSWTTGIALACVALTACGPTGESSVKKESTSYTYKGEKLTIRAGNSDVLLRSADDGDTVRVNRTLEGKAGDDDNSRWSLTGSTLSLETHCNGISTSCAARYTVTLPKNIAVHLVSSNGKVRSTGLAQEQEIESSNAPVTVEGASGKARLTVRGGNAEATGIASGEFSAETRDGRLKVVFAKPPRKVSTVTVNGNANVTLPPGSDRYRIGITAENGQANSSVTDTKGAERTVKVHSQNGNARIDREE
ncbi:DUF4097 family beta strand repeat-containing protein [Streptomyces tsukubensis]|uniref:Adhesin domain-containing protein n=1 Tax=Streptomyces tsukubensis TaxID=83656 RepID=A0A1V4A2L3_9ACTN|nr:DUF4097 family beta strand repeat-containing protein [Streptomyces tsukubensis]OON72934.1 hypothetical protein B1H18_28425 [Streptomyces tsukubensis]QFR94466.1 hypothetical protein GBW32_17210 [Streptomyces tsukubensis]